MKFYSKHRTTARCKPCCGDCRNNNPSKNANVVVENTYAKTKIANPTVIWSYKESIHSNTDNEDELINGANGGENCPQKPHKREDCGKSSRANRGKLNAMVLG